MELLTQIDTHISIMWLIGILTGGMVQIVGLAIWINNIKNKTDVNTEKIADHVVLIKENSSKDASSDKEMNDKWQGVDKRLIHIDYVLTLFAEKLDVKIPTYNP